MDPTGELPDANPHYHGTEEWDAFNSGRRDTLTRIVKQPLKPINEDHLVMLGQAYMAGVRSVRLAQRAAPETSVNEDDPCCSLTS